MTLSSDQLNALDAEGRSRAAPRPTANERFTLSTKRLGRLPRKADPRDLHAQHFLRAAPAPPPRTNFWPRRTAFPLRLFGNDQYGDCTKASEALASMRFERLETRRTPKITDEEVIRVYLAMTERLYGGGDTGAFELDALNEWRDPELTFKDTSGRPLTIDAHVRVDPSDPLALRQALAAAAAHGIKVCFALPLAWQGVIPPADWDCPETKNLTGVWLPGSWGGHSMFAEDYDEVGVWIPGTWGYPRQRVTWRAMAAYCDEAHIVIDSWDYWRAKKPEAAKLLDLVALRRAVNRVSRRKIA